MKRRLKIDILAKVLASSKRVKILLIIDQYGPLRYSELMEKLGIKNSGELNYHLSFLKEAGMVTLDTESGQRRYTLTVLGEKTVDFLKELGSILISRELGLRIIDEWGIAYSYDAHKLVNILKKEFGLTSKQAGKILKDLDTLLLDLNLTFYRKNEINQIILAVLLKNKLIDNFINNAMIGLKSKELDGLLEHAIFYDEFADLLSQNLLLTFNVSKKLPSSIRTLLQSGIFYISHIQKWPFGFEEVVLDALPLTRDMDYLLDVHNFILSIKKLSHFIYLRNFNKAIYQVFKNYGGSKVLDLNKFILKSLKMVFFLRNNINYDQFAIEMTIDDSLEEDEILEFTTTILEQMIAFKKVSNPPIILNIKSLNSLKLIETTLYNLIFNHIPVTLINSASDMKPVFSPPFILNESLEKTIVVENSFNILLPVLTFYARENRKVAEDFLKNIASSLIIAINKKRQYLHRKGYFQKLHFLIKNKVRFVNSFSILGGELATKIIKHFSESYSSKAYMHTIKLLSALCDEIIRLTKTTVGDLKLAFSSTDINLYEVMYRALSYNFSVLSSLNMESFNLQSPFSKVEVRPLKEKIAIENALYEKTGIPGIFTVEFSNPFPTLNTFKKLIERILREKIKIVNFSFDFTSCTHCGYVMSGHVNVCPSCSSVYPFVMHYGRPIIDYQPLKHLPNLAINEYRKRDRINEISLRKEF